MPPNISLEPMCQSFARFGPCGAQLTPVRRTLIYLQMKLAASSVLPFPVYVATCG